VGQFSVQKVGHFWMQFNRFKDNIAKDTPFIGIILYTGETALSFGGSLWAVPFGAMWN